MLVTAGGARHPPNVHKPRHRKRWPSALYMDGPSLLNFTVAAVPKLVEDILKTAELGSEAVDLYLMHQATRKLLEQLQQQLGLDDEKLPIRLEDCGNTVSSTIPILIRQLRDVKKLQPGMRSMLVGFGVGLSWAGCLWTETWSGG